MRTEIYSKYSINQPLKSLFTFAAHQTQTQKILSREWNKTALDLCI